MSKPDDLDLGMFLGRRLAGSMRFSTFIKMFREDPKSFLHTSSTLLAEAIRYFGYEIVIRSGEPTVSYKVFKDPFSKGAMAVFGQEFSIKRIVEVIESAGRESAPQRGIVLVGPPASGKTNIVDLIGQALEEYSKRGSVRLYSFYFRFSNEEGKIVELRPVFRHHPLLLFPTSLRLADRTTHPRQELFEHINEGRPADQHILFPAFYQNAYLDKRSLDIIENLQESPRNRGKTLFEILEEYVRIEEIDFSNAQAKGIANIDDMHQLKTHLDPVNLGRSNRAVVSEHLPAAQTSEYDGAMVAANRGLLHIHDAFGSDDENGPDEEDYKPLLMLLGSGKVSVESTQTPIDATVLITTNIEEMSRLERQLTSSKLLDRIEEVPVNYLLDAYSEMEILRRDMASIRESFDVDPNLLLVATCFAVLTRLLPPREIPSHVSWNAAKERLYHSITPEQKLFIYASAPADPVATIRKLPAWHPFQSEMIRLGIHIADLEADAGLIAQHPERMTLDQTGVFSNEELKLIDDEFMRALWKEHSTREGKHGISVRQLQNLMRDTINSSLGQRVHAGTFFRVLGKTFGEERLPKRWLAMGAEYGEREGSGAARRIGNIHFAPGEGDYGDFEGLAEVARAIYHEIIRRQITMATVNRDPDEIAFDLRKYVQHVLLMRARANRAFAHVMVPRFTYSDPATGERVDEPDLEYLESIEEILAPDGDPAELRREVGQRFLDLHDRGTLTLEEGRSLVSSRIDNFLTCFGPEYALLLSHRKTFGNIDPERLTEAFFQRQADGEKYQSLSPDIRDFVREVLQTMGSRFGYSEDNALDTVLFALRKGIVDFSEIIS